MVAALQVSVAPLFPIAGATAELGIAAILAALLVGGPRAAMLMTPAVALALSFGTDLAPGAVLIGYTAVLPIGYLLDRYGMPPGDYPRLLLTAVLAGVWLRLVLSFEAFAEGAALAPGPLLAEVLLPGIVFDAVLASAVYLPLRLAGQSHLTFVLQRRSWLP
jgi:hypothetical protein